jgi:hypothetical protein
MKQLLALAAFGVLMLYVWAAMLSPHRAADVRDTVERSPWAKGLRRGATHLSGAQVIWISSFEPLTLETAYRHGFQAGDIIQIIDMPGPAAINGARMVIHVIDPYHFSIARPSGIAIDVSMHCADCHRFQ